MQLDQTQREHASADQRGDGALDEESTTDITMRMLVLGRGDPAFEAGKKKDAPKK